MKIYFYYYIMAGFPKSVDNEVRTVNTEIMETPAPVKTPSSVDILHSAVKDVMKNILQIDVGQFVGNNQNGEYGNILSIMSDIRKAQEAIERIKTTLPKLPPKIQNQISGR